MLLYGTLCWANLQNMHIINLVANDNLLSKTVKPIYGTTINTLNENIPSLLPSPSSGIMSPLHFLKSNKWNANLTF